MFDPATFLNVSTDQALSTEYANIPEGDYPSAQIGTITEKSIRTFESNGTEYFVLEVPWIIEGSDVAKAATGRDKNRVRQSVFLDVLKDGSGNVVGLEGGKGQNVPLGKLRTTLRQNVAGRPWSFKALEGSFAGIHVKHRIDGDKIYAEVDEVRAL